MTEYDWGDLLMSVLFIVVGGLWGAAGLGMLVGSEGAHVRATRVFTTELGSMMSSALGGDIPFPEWPIAVAMLVAGTLAVSAGLSVIFGIITEEHHAA